MIGDIFDFIHLQRPYTYDFERKCFQMDLSRFTTCELIDKGWSGDKKYCVTDADGTK